MDLKTIKPMSVNGNMMENWKLWKQKYEIYSIATELNKKSEEIQCNMFLHLIGEDCLQIFNSFAISNEEKNKIAPLMKKFEEHFVPRRNLT